jgi:hypothetical protein
MGSLTQLQLVRHGSLRKQLHTLPQVLGQANRCLHSECIALCLQGLQLYTEYTQAQHIEHHQPSQGVKGGEPTGVLG